MTTQYLKHYGVKGMKWGVRKDDAVLARIAGGRIQGETKQDRAKYKEYKKQTSRKEQRADREEALNQRIFKLLDDVKDKPLSLIDVASPGARMLMTGREFSDYLVGGGSLDRINTNLSSWEIDQKPRG